MQKVKNRTGCNKNIHPGTTVVNRNPLRSTGAALFAILAAVFLLSGFGDFSQERKYECAGKNDNGMVSFREFPSLHFYGHRLKIAGSDTFSTYSYEICEESDTLVTFASRQEVCPAGHPEINSLSASSGSFNKVSGLLELIGAQGLHGEYQCKEVAQK